MSVRNVPPVTYTTRLTVLFDDYSCAEYHYYDRDMGLWPVREFDRQIYRYAEARDYTTGELLAHAGMDPAEAGLIIAAVGRR